MSENWYYSENGQQRGPVGLEEMRGLTLSGRIRPGDLVWNATMPNWVAAQSIGQLWAAPAGGAPARAPRKQAPGAVAAAGVARKQAPGAVATAGVAKNQASGPLLVDYSTPSMGGEVSPKSMQMLRQTRGWVLFLAILMAVVGAIMAVIGVLLLVGAGSRTFGFGRGEIVSLRIAGVTYLLMSLLVMLVPATYLSRYAAGIRKLAHMGRLTDLEDALEAQKTFWRYTGIISLVALCVYALVILVAVVAALAGA